MGSLSYSKDYIVVEVDDQDQFESSSWAQRKKKQKMIEIPQRTREGILQIIPRGTSYFYEARRSFLMKQANDEESSWKKIETKAIGSSRLMN